MKCGVFLIQKYRLNSNRIKFESCKKYKTKKGIVQGSPLSPLLANIALHGMLEKLGKDVCVVSYADDFIVLAQTVEVMKCMIHN